MNIEDNPRLKAEWEAMGEDEDDVGALFAHLRSVHGGEPPPLEVLMDNWRKKKEAAAEKVAAEKAAAEKARRVTLSDLV